jgi:mevalonate kinase
VSKPLTFHSNGKLLLTAEYVVLDGATALALPSKFGQSLTITPTNTEHINWQSLDQNGNIWFEDQFSLNTFQSTQSNLFSQRLSQIFEAIEKLQPNFFTIFQGLDIQTRLEFDRDWGLGSSSTLINNLADWANIDAYKLLELTFGGSGYDIACASHDTAIFYQLNSKIPQIEVTTFDPNFKNELHFVHLNKKQNSRDGIAHYKAQKTLNSHTIEAINKISNDLTTCITLSVFEALIDQHEDLISKTINLEPIKTTLFPDFEGSIKSLGAWGGDFILVTGIKTYCETYFKSKGYHTIISFEDMIK